MDARNRSSLSKTRLAPLDNTVHVTTESEQTKLVTMYIQMNTMDWDTSRKATPSLSVERKPNK